MKDQGINERIAFLINHLGISQTAFAKSLGTSTSRITNITQGRNRPDSQLLSAIANKYPQVELTWLLTGKGTADRNVNLPRGENAEILTSEPESFNSTPSTDSHHDSHPNSHHAEKRDVEGNEVSKSKNGSGVPAEGKKGSKAGARGKLLSVQEFMALPPDQLTRYDAQERTKRRQELSQQAKNHHRNLHERLRAYLTRQAPHLYQLKQDTEDLLDLIRMCEKVTGLYLMPAFETDTLVIDPTASEPERLDLLTQEAFRTRAVADLTERAPYAPAVSQLLGAIRAFLTEVRPLDTHGVIDEYLLTGTEGSENASKTPQN